MFIHSISAASTVDIQNPNQLTPEVIVRHLQCLMFNHWNFQNEVVFGEFILHEAIIHHVKEFVALAFELQFPIHQAKPVSVYNWDDRLSCDANNSSGHNMRFIAGTKRLSKHATGTAFDINPRQNPCFDIDEVTAKVVEVIPPDGRYDLRQPGTLYRIHPLVQLMKKYGWSWGGDWNTPVDHQHFQIALPEHTHWFT